MAFKTIGMSKWYGTQRERENMGESAYACVVLKKITLQTCVRLGGKVRNTRAYPYAFADDMYQQFLT